jgi:hypothetical protein
MAFKTDEILKESEQLPADEYSINSYERPFEDSDAARRYFDDLRHRFTDIEHWNLNSDVASYELHERDGALAANGRIRPGLFMKITLAGSGKSDWVSIENLVLSPDELMIIVKPTYDPTQRPPDTGKISHFFEAKARNHFCAVRDGNKVKVYVIGLHETPNTGHAGGIVETLRNAAVANLGYYLGLQKAMWTAFCKRFLSDDNA